MTTLLQRIAAAHYVANETQVETLAHERYAANITVIGSDDTYLRIILVESQSKLGRKVRGRVNKGAQTAVLKAAHERFYPCVLKGVTTSDIAVEDGIDSKESQRRSLERNRRSNFARSSYSTLGAYVEAGGDLRTLVPEQTSKASIRKAIAPAEPADKVDRQISRAQGALLRACTRKARSDPEAAREAIESAIEALQETLAGLGTETEPAVTTARRAPRDKGPARTRVGAPMLHRPQA